MVQVDGVTVQDYFKNLISREVDGLENAPAFRCLRGAFHVLTASRALVLFEFVVLFVLVLVAFPWCLFWFIPHVLLILVTIYALKKEKPRFMFPIIVIALVEFAVACVLITFSFVVAIFSNSSFLGFFGQDHHEDFVVRLLIVILVKAFLLASAAFLFWRFTVFRTTRVYFETKQDGEAAPPKAEGMKGLLTPV